MDKKIIFVIGSGRSGTHLIGRIIGSHQDVDPYIEDERTFTLSTKIATQQVERGKIKKLIKNYKNLFNKSKSPAILEKSHPNIWFVEELLAAFPEAKFVGIYRDVYSTVSSMLQHEGVSNWFNLLPLNVSNPFLGISNKNKEVYASLSIEQKSALRWESHKVRLLDLAKKLPSNVMVMNYNDLLLNQDEHLEKLSKFLGLTNQFKPESFNLESLNKWKSYLNKDQISRIDEVITRLNGKDY
ncbi:MAG: sulfotransferase [Fulvivirga sp.]